MIDYIRKTYQVPAKRGCRVLYAGREGTITGSHGLYLRIKLDGEKRSFLYHPTHNIEYLEAERER